MHLMYYLENGKRVYTLKVSCGQIVLFSIKKLGRGTVRLVPRRLAETRVGAVSCNCWLASSISLTLNEIAQCRFFVSRQKL